MIKMNEINQFLTRHKRSVLLISTLVLVVVLVINLCSTPANRTPRQYPSRISIQNTMS